LGPPFHGDDAACYLAIIRNRGSVVLDLRTPEGAGTVRRLVGACDVVIENFLPGQIARLGLDDLRDTSPHAVRVSVRGAAPGGPLADLPSYDAVTQGRAGLRSVTGHPETGPVEVGCPSSTPSPGCTPLGASGALLGVARRAPTGAGGGSAARMRRRDISATGGKPPRGRPLPVLLGNAHPDIVPYGPMPTADGRIIVGATGERTVWRRGATCRRVRR